LAYSDVVEIWSIVLAAGSGTRFRGSKQFELLGGERLVDRAVETAASACDAVVVVLPKGTTWDGPAVAAAVHGGPTRSASVRSGLGHVPDAAEIIVVHQAAHPLASKALFESVVEKVQAGADGAFPGLPVTDTVKRIEHSRVAETVLGPGLVTAQTPHAFRAYVLRAAHAGGKEAVDDTVLVEAIGGTIVAVPGDPGNIHVTTRAELELAGRLLEPH
jgi:2-C-methyl-D-erythritol 4-phosphate cytidylyltransferase